MAQHRQDRVAFVTQPPAGPRALGSRSLPVDPPLRDYIAYHLARKGLRRRASTVTRDRQALANVVGFLEVLHGPGLRLSAVGSVDLEDYLEVRRQEPGVRRGTTVAVQTMRNELHALSNVYKRALRERRVGENPVASVEPLVREQGEAVWLELDEAARLLEAAAAMDAAPAANQVPFLCPLLATYLLTGGRKREVAGLEVLELDLERRLVHIRPNRWRALKRTRHHRTVPLWPQLETILRRYLMVHPRVDLLFPATTGGMLTSIRKSLAQALERAGIAKPVTLHTLRHTYAATRLQTTDQGQPVSPYTVMRELGHASFGLIEQTYGHVQTVRSRADVVAYERTRAPKASSSRERRSA